MEQNRSSFGDKVTDILATIIHFVRQNKKMVAIGGIALLGLILIIIGTTRSDPVEMVQEFEKAVVMGDTKKLSRLVTPGDKELKIDEKKLQQFVEYAQKNQTYFQDQIWVLRAQTAYLTESDEMVDYSLRGVTTRELLEIGDFYIKKENFLWFDTYEIAARPLYLNLATNEADAVLYVDGEEVFKTTEKKKSYTYGPVMPGIYEATAEKKFEYANLTVKNEVNLFKQRGKRNIPVNLELVGERVRLNSNFEDTNVYVNGKKVGVVKDLESFGPITKDGSVKIYGEAKFPWGTSKSRVITVEKNVSEVGITPVPTTDKKVRDEITNLINTYAKERSKALSTKDSKVITTLEGSAKNDLISEINRMSHEKDRYEGKAIETKIDYDNASLNKDANTGRFYMQIPVEFHFNEYKYFRWTNQNAPLRDEIFQRRLHITYFDESKKWLITNVEKIYFQKYEMDGKGVVKTNLE